MENLVLVLENQTRLSSERENGAGDDYTSSDVLSSGQDVYPEIFMLCLVDTRNVTQQ